MHERRFNGDVGRLRNPERVARLEVERVVDLCLEGLDTANSLPKVLDVGTGSGLFAESFARHGLEVWGVDANPDMIPVAQAFVTQADFRVSIAEELPFSDRAFDLVFLGLVLHETDDPLRAVQEARRVARKRVCIIEWPYIETEFGPPLEDRMSPARIMEIARQCGIAFSSPLSLKNVSLYRFILN